MTAEAVTWLPCGTALAGPGRAERAAGQRDQYGYLLPGQLTALGGTHGWGSFPVVGGLTEPNDAAPDRWSRRVQRGGAPDRGEPLAGAAAHRAFPLGPATVGALALAGLGMLLSTVIASPGYFIADHQGAPAAMIAVLAVLTVAAIAGILVPQTPAAGMGPAALETGT